MNSLIRRLAILILGCSALAAAGAKPVPDLKFHDLDGRTQKLSSLRGSITVISFWATWCAPCREELPRLSVLKQQYADKGIRFLAISVDESKDRAKIEPYLQKQNITLDVWAGAGIDTLDRLQLGNVVPATIVLDKDGAPVGRILGEARDSDVTGYLDWLLNNRQGPAPAPQIKRY
jgi:thiol-disulfide isomerase/thioredoxin